MPNNCHDNNANDTTRDRGTFSSGSRPPPSRQTLVVPTTQKAENKHNKLKSSKCGEELQSRNIPVAAHNTGFYSWRRRTGNNPTTTTTTTRRRTAPPTPRLAGVVSHERDSIDATIAMKRSRRRQNMAILLLTLLLVVCSCYLIHESFDRHSKLLTVQKNLEAAADEQIWRKEPKKNNTLQEAIAGLSFSLETAVNASLEKASSGLSSKSKRNAAAAENFANVNGRKKEKAPKFAYAWLLGGMPSKSAVHYFANEKTPSPPNHTAAHLGLIYNVLVSVKILKDSGSKADFVVLVHMAVPNEELPAHQVKWFTDMDIKIIYVPPSCSYVNEQSTIVLEKFRILEWTDYDRVLYMSPDIMPYCNLDYIMTLSWEGKLEPNFLLSIGSTPASGSFFMLQPSPGAFSKFLRILTQRRRHFDDFGPKMGFGVFMHDRKHYWRALSSGLNVTGDRWDFLGGDSDQGLLYHYARYVHGNVSIAIGPEVEHYRLGERYFVHRNGTFLNRYSCLPRDVQYGNQRYPSDSLRMQTSPNNTAPYRDFAQWQFKSVKPWHQKKAPPCVKSIELVNSAEQHWFYFIRQLDEQIELGLNFTGNMEPDKEEPEKRHNEFADSANWNHVPIQKHKDFTPLWSTRIQSLTLWALRIENPSEPQTFSLEANDFRKQTVPVSSSPDKSAKTGGKEKRGFVCVTGQFDRLELKNKIETIFKPLQKDGYATDAALVVSEGKASFTNHDKMNISDFTPLYFNFSDAVEDLESNKIRVVSYNGTYKRLENPPVNEKYRSLLHKRQDFFRDASTQNQRVQNHARIFESYTRCLDYADKAAVAAGFRNSSEYYKVFIRIRDDAGLSKPLDQMGLGAKVMLDAIPPPANSVVVTECRNWYGMNDRLAIVAPDIAHLYFTRPYHVLANDRFFDERVVRNPESFLLTVYTASGIHVLGHPDLKVVVRIVKKQNGEVILHEKRMPICPAPFVYLKRNYEIYGWAL